MRTIEVSKRAQALNKLLRQARRETLILRCSDGQEFVLAELDDFDREVEMTRNNQSLMKFLDSRASKRKRIPLSEIRRKV